MLNPGGLLHRRAPLTLFSNSGERIPARARLVRGARPNYLSQMHPSLKRKLTIVATVLGAAAFAGGAFAATQTTAANMPQAFLQDVAKRLNVTPARLSAALRNAFFDQLKTAVVTGGLTQAQANAIRQHVQQTGVAPLGPTP